MPESRAPRTKEELIKDFRTSEILEAARRVVGALGIADASMERIAHEAGIAKGTIYLYFKNKEELLLHVVQHGFDELMEHSHKAADSAVHATERLRAVVRSALAHTNEHEAFFRAVGADGASLLEEESERQVAQYVGFIEDLVEQGIRDGEFRDYPARRIAIFLTESLRGAVRERFAASMRPSIDQEADSIVDFFLNGIKSGNQT